MTASVKTSISYDARGKAFGAVALCADGRVRSVKVRGNAASYSTSVAGMLSVSPAGTVLFLERRKSA